MRGLEVRNIVHFAVDAERAGLGLGSKSIDDAACLGNLFGGWRKAAVDRRDLVGMNGNAARKAIASRAQAITLKAFDISEIGI